jgi:hypothetical protein
VFQEDSPKKDSPNGGVAHVRRRFLLLGLRLPSSSSSSCVRFLFPLRGGLAESYLAGKRALAVGCEHFAVRSQMSTAFTLLSVHQGFTQLLQKLAYPLGGGEE